MKLQNLQIQFHGKDPLQHRITHVNENGTQCRETLLSGVDFAQHVIDCLESVPTLIKERDDLTEYADAMRIERDALRESHSMIATALQIDSTKSSDILKAVDTLRKERDERYAPDATQPQLSEIRYVLHGDIQPCSVLYSDETTTLSRLDEGDMMLETDTIEWSDSVTYRCQELLKSVDVRSLGHMTPRLAQLVRDERILLNDDALETSGTVDLKVDSDSDIGVGQPVVQVRKHDATDIPFMRHSLVPEHSIEQPCDECGHVFDADSMTCPMCNTIRPSKQER